MNQPQYFEIQSDDLQRTKTFYEAVFGWKFLEQQGLPMPYFRIETGGIAGGLRAIHSASSKLTRTPSSSAA